MPARALMMVGTVMVAGAVAGADQWITPPWQPTPGGLTHTQTQQSANVVEVIDGLVYVGGDFDRAGGTLVNGITAWNGTSWMQFGPAATPGFEKVEPGNAVPLAITKYGGELVVGGSMIVADDGVTNIRHLARYDTSSGTWDALGYGVSTGITNGGVVRALAVYDGKLIVGGKFTQAGSLGPTPVTVSNIAAWDGTNWTTLGEGVSGEGVYALAVYEGALYAAGWFDSAGGVAVNNLAKWNGTAWQDVGGGLTDDDTFFFAYGAALEVHNNELYIGGLFALAGNAPAKHITRWNGTAFQSVGGGVSGSPITFFLTGVYALQSFDGQLVASGEFDTAGTTGAASIASWNGTTWASTMFPSGLGAGAASSVGGMGLATDGPRLYVVGDFATSGGLATPMLGVFETTAACAGDFDGMNGVTIDDLFLFLNAWFTGDVRADVDGQNGVAIDDLFLFLNAWFVGC